MAQLDKRIRRIILKKLNSLITIRIVLKRIRKKINFKQAKNLKEKLWL
jgi:hypothetical protein